MHADMKPWWPIVSGNGLLDWISIDQLPLVCVVLGVLGAAGYAWRVRLGQRRAADDSTESA